MPNEFTVTAHEMADPEFRLALPDEWTGVQWHWDTGDFTECRACVENNPSQRHDTPVVGYLLFEGLVCGQDHEENLRAAAPEGAIAYKYEDPTEEARWVYDQRDAEEIRRQDPSLLVWVIDH